MTSACVVCGRGGLVPFLEVERVPVFCNVLWPSRAEALEAPRGDIALAFCDGCGLLRNLAFDPDLVRYSPGYENSLHFSPSFQRFAEKLARRLIDRYDLRDKQVIDVGCGRGDFLSLLCELGGNHGVGYDPSHPGSPNGGNPSFVSGYYAGQSADFISCRHVLEHVETPSELLDTLAPQATVYVEVPSGDHMLRETAIWDLIYEHPSYFTTPALAFLFESRGFGVLDLGASFGGQYLYVEAARGHESHVEGGSPDPLARLTDEFTRRVGEKTAEETRRLARLDDRGSQAAVWGAGSKGVSFLNMIDCGERVVSVVDINPRKQGRFVPGTGQRIDPPESLRRSAVDVVLAMNPLYMDEIRRSLLQLGVHADVIAV
jgi:Methyltransferase domain/C-methyltransferase C-terminal domain